MNHRLQLTRLLALLPPLLSKLGGKLRSQSNMVPHEVTKRGFKFRENLCYFSWWLVRWNFAQSLPLVWVAREKFADLRRSIPFLRTRKKVRVDEKRIYVLVKRIEPRIIP